MKKIKKARDAVLSASSVKVIDDLEYQLLLYNLSIIDNSSNGDEGIKLSDIYCLLHHIHYTDVCFRKSLMWLNDMLLLLPDIRDRHLEGLPLRPPKHDMEFTIAPSNSLDYETLFELKASEYLSRWNNIDKANFNKEYTQVHELFQEMDKSLGYTNNLTTHQRTPIEGVSSDHKAVMLRAYRDILKRFKHYSYWRQAVGLNHAYEDNLIAPPPLHGTLKHKKKNK